MSKPSRRQMLQLLAAALAGTASAFRRGVGAARQSTDGSGVAADLDDAPGWVDRYCEVCSNGPCSGGPCQDTPRHDPPTLVTDPSVDGQSLQLTHLGGPSYANVLYDFRLWPNDYPGITDATAFTLDLQFLYRPATTFDNANGLSRIQALEFAIRLWRPGAMWDWEIQWNVVPTGLGGDPEWRALVVGDEQPDQWVPTGVDAGLALVADQWHHLTLAVRLADGQAWYDRFAIDGAAHDLGLSAPPKPTTYGDTLMTIHVQLDGPDASAPAGFAVFLDQVTLTWDGDGAAAPPSAHTPGESESQPSAPPSCGPLQPAIDLGQNTYQGPQLSLPEPADSCTLYIAHGDILGDGTCHVRFFDSGETVGGLSSATWRLVRVSGGTHEERLTLAESIQQGAAQFAGGSCPQA